MSRDHKITDKPEQEIIDWDAQSQDIIVLIYSLIAGSVGCFLTPLLWGIVLKLADATELSLVEFLFLNLPIFEFIVGKTLSVFSFVLVRILTGGVSGGVFGYFAYSNLKPRKPLIIILGAFFLGVIVGVPVLLFGIGMSMM